jgi:hypothetical protein
VVKREKMIIPDIRINSMVRNVLASHWVDLQHLNYGSYKGTVRLHGELRYLGQREFLSNDGSKLEVIEGEIRHVQGVKRIHIDLLNWRKNHKGAWESRVITRPIFEEKNPPPMAPEVPSILDPAPLEMMATSPR